MMYNYFNQYKNYGYNLSSAVLNILSQIAILIYFNHKYGLELAGLFSVSIAITGPLYMFFNMQLKWLIATEKILYSFEEYLSTRILTSAIGFVFGVIIFIFSTGINSFYFFLCVSTFKFFESISEIPYGIFQKQENFRLIFFFSLFKAFGIFFILIIDTVYKLRFSIIFYISILYGLSLLIEILKINLANTFIFKKIDSISIIKKIKANWKYGIVSFLVSLKTNIPRYFLSAIGLEKLAIFTTLNYLNYGSNFLFSSLGEVNNVRLSKNVISPYKSIFNFLLLSFLYSLFFLIFFISFKLEIVFLLFGKQLDVSWIFSVSIFLSGFTSIAVVIVQNYFMVYRFSDRLLFYNFFEIMILLLFFFLNYFFLKLDTDFILFIPIFISTFFALVSFKSFKKLYNAYKHEF